MAAGLVAGGVLVVIASGKEGFVATGNLAANGYGDHSPGGYGLAAALVTEILLTAFFLYIILGALTLERRRASPRSPSALA